MFWEDLKKVKGTKKELRKFGITLGIFFSLVGGFVLWQRSDLCLSFFILSFLLLASALFLPSLLRPVHKIWMGLALMIGGVMSGVILSFLFYFILTPIAFLGKIFKKDFLDLRWKEAKESYWIVRSETPYNKTRYENQF